MTNKRAEISSAIDDRRLFPRVDRCFILFVALEFLAFPFIPLLPLAVAAAALATPLRKSKWRMTALWGLGGILALIVAAPFILGLFDLQLVQNGPAHTATPG